MSVAPSVMTPRDFVSALHHNAFFDPTQMAREDAVVPRTVGTDQFGPAMVPVGSDRLAAFTNSFFGWARTLQRTGIPDGRVDFPSGNNSFTRLWVDGVGGISVVGQRRRNGNFERSFRVYSPDIYGVTSNDTPQYNAYLQLTPTTSKARWKLTTPGIDIVRALVRSGLLHADDTQVSPQLLFMQAVVAAMNAFSSGASLMIGAHRNSLALGNRLQHAKKVGVLLPDVASHFRSQFKRGDYFTLASLCTPKAGDDVTVQVEWQRPKTKERNDWGTVTIRTERSVTGIDLSAGILFPLHAPSEGTGLAHIMIHAAEQVRGQLYPH